MASRSNANDTEKSSESKPDAKEYLAAFILALLGIEHDTKPGAESSEAQEKGEDDGRLWNVIVTLLVVVGAAVLIAYAIVYVITEAAPSNESLKFISIGTAGVSLASLIPASGHVITASRDIVQYVQGKKNPDLFSNFVRIGTTVLAVAVAVFAAREVATDPQPPERPSTSPQIIYLAERNSAPIAPVAHISFFYDLARDSDKWTSGVDLNDDQKKDLDQIMASLSACSEAGARVEMEIRGYADNNEFLQDTNLLNWKTANRRSSGLHEEVQLRLDRISDVSKPLLKPLHQWPQSDFPGNMERDRYMNTRPLRSSDDTSDQGLFNRRADIQIASLGACNQVRRQ